MIGGVAFLYGFPYTVIALEKGTETSEKIERNFGSAHPEGYRKALRLMKQAEKFHRPVICIVDTAGAYCGIDAEERGQGQAIAENLYEMITLKTPIVSLLIGEGGSGGALALAVADEALDDGEFRLFRHFPRGLRQHSLERRQESAGGGKGAQADRFGSAFPWGD